ncbi:hypothetical protein QTP86_002937 [Hemibagrus guttatus]|nr:hypothetical protein QTP86_002937 [Hemibagrus guttatus]
MAVVVNPGLDRSGFTSLFHSSSGAAAFLTNREAETEKEGITATFQGREIGIITLQEKLKTLKIPDLSGSEKVSPIGKVSYSLSGGRHSKSSLSTYPYLLHPQHLHPLASYPH